MRFYHLLDSISNLRHLTLGNPRARAERMLLFNATLSICSLIGWLCDPVPDVSVVQTAYEREASSGSSLHDKDLKVLTTKCHDGAGGRFLCEPSAGAMIARMKITPLDVRQKQFESKLRGRDPKAVQEFLELLANELEELVRESIQLKDEVKRRGQRIEDLHEILLCGVEHTEVI